MSTTTETYDGGAAEQVGYAPDTGMIQRLGAAEVIAFDRVREDPDVIVDRISDVAGYAPYTGLYRVTDLGAERDGTPPTYYLRAES